MPADEAGTVLLITGHQRSGTGYMAALCQACGLDVGHERPGKDGISSFQFAVDTDRVCFHTVDQHRGSNHYRFDRVVHVVRHPLDVIASTAFTDMNGAIEWQAGFVPVDLNASPVVRAAQTWLGWTDLADAKADRRMRIEDAATELPAWMGVRCIQLPPNNVNARPHARLSREALIDDIGSDLYRKVRAQAERFGYEL